jgi:hypothetical protein
VLGWSPRYSGDDLLPRFVEALLAGEGAPGPLLDPAGGPQRDPADDAANVPG